MEEGSRVGAHAHALSLYGGSAPTTVPDDLRRGVAEDAVGGPVVNGRHRRMAECCGRAVVPARPRGPRGKGAVETGPGP